MWQNYSKYVSEYVSKKNPPLGSRREGDFFVSGGCRKLLVAHRHVRVYVAHDLPTVQKIIKLLSVQPGRALVVIENLVDGLEHALFRFLSGVLPPFLIFHDRPHWAYLFAIS